jgi:Fe-S-cluster-containing dehydrogenase component
MSFNRREFLRWSLLSAAGLTCPALAGKLFAGSNSGGHAVPPSALKGKRWAMAVDVGKCRPGCRDCIDACHTVHNVPDFGNPKDEIRWIGLERFENIFPAEVNPYAPESEKERELPVLCNHCADPPCVRVCPTKATFKRPDGIVMMDYHRCIGCRFCMAACPYGARSMNFRNPRPFIKKINPDFPTRTKGVVEKCNFCEERLARGVLPACVLACKEKALVFGDAEDARSEIRRLLSGRNPLRRRVNLGTGPQIYYLL